MWPQVSHRTLFKPLIGKVSAVFGMLQFWQVFS